MSGIQPLGAKDMGALSGIALFPLRYKLHTENAELKRKLSLL
jgi:hypothetical protein